MHIHDTDCDHMFEKLYMSLGSLGRHSNGTHRLKTKGKAMQRECSNGDGGERVQVVPTGKSTTRLNEVAYSPLWSKRTGSKQYKSITMNLNVGGFFNKRRTCFFPFFQRYFEIRSIIKNGKYFLR